MEFKLGALTRISHGYKGMKSSFVQKIAIETLLGPSLKTPVTSTTIELVTKGAGGNGKESHQSRR